MTIKVTSEQELIEEVFQVLMTHLEPSKVLRFWATCGLGEGDYLKTKDQLFEQETVDSLYEKTKLIKTTSNKNLSQSSVG